MFRCAPVPRIGFKPMPTSGVVIDRPESRPLVMLPGGIGEHGMVEDVEYFPLELQREALGEFKVLEN